MGQFQHDRDTGAFRRALSIEFNQYLLDQGDRYPPSECLAVDLHCHDHNSDIPDELWGRILGLPETWLKTKDLVKCLKHHGSDVFTITNHNNARSCWQLLDKGQDVLVGAEFTCHFPEYELFSHVLTYGFTPEQEPVLNRKRQDIYEFLRYTAEHDIPVVLPHPLYFYTRNQHIDLALFEKLAVMFQRFEVLNGQRDLWQSTLTLNWVQGLTPDKIRHYARKHGLDPADFGVDPERPKVLTGGSDDHMGVFAGQCGSYLHVPDLAHRLQGTKPSELALEALRKGTLVPFGHVGENQKLNIALLDYFAQIATHIEDPGLLRILLHRGETRDKVACFAIANLLLELQKHKHSKRFFNFMHDALNGRKPNKMLRWKVSKDYRFCIEYLERIADSKKGSPEEFVATVNHAIGELFNELNRLIVKRIRKTSFVAPGNVIENFSTEDLARKFEVPSQVTALFTGGGRKTDMSNLNVNRLFDNLSFPVLISLVLTGATLASTRLLYQNREFLNRFAASIGRNHHARRALHLTDTLRDRNGVSNSLSGKLAYVQRHDLPLDMLVCHDTIEPEAHLHVVPPLATFVLPEASQQEIRFPDLMAIARIFYDEGYDRIVCSTEGPMVLVALFLKYMFNVPCHFVMHTDWIDYVRYTSNASKHERDRIRRLLRLLYGQFDGVFVLNTEHRDWLTGHEMQLDPARVRLTAHHAAPRLRGIKPIDKRELFPDAGENTPVLFIACRLSAEKGVFDLPEVLRLARQALPDLQIVIAGTGPAEAELRELLPDAHFTGWIDKQRLTALYLGLDLFVFPSRFDTFGNVILESFTHGMPVIAYDCKGPRDIIQHGVNGFLVPDAAHMARRIVAFFRRPEERAGMRRRAVARAGEYRDDLIMGRFLADLGLADPVVEVVDPASDQRSVA